MAGIGNVGTIAGIETGSIAVESTGSLAPGQDGAFGTELLKALEGLQIGADVQSRSLAMGAGNLHETMLALEKADVAMRLSMKVRNKLVEAYQEVMRMSV